MTKFNALVVAALFTVSHCRADDGYVQLVGGNASLMAENRDIAMTAEYVRIDLFESTYTVRAEFEFFNSGKSTAVLVGFPVNGEQEGTKLLRFKSWVNGRMAELKDIRDAKKQPNSSDGEYSSPEPEEYWKTKLVVFPSGEVTKTSVEYSAPMGMDSVGHNTVAYIYGTGGSWKGPIGHAIFDFRFNEDRLITPPCGPSQQLFHRSFGQIVYEMRDIHPHSGREFISFQLIPLEKSVALVRQWNVDKSSKPMDGLWEAGEDLRYVSSMPRDEWDAFQKTKHQLRTSEPAAFKKRFPIDGFGCNGDLRILSNLQLRLHRNAVFARHGREFKDPELHDYFSLMSWYHLSGTANPVLTDVEKETVSIFLAQELQLKEAKPFEFTSGKYNKRSPLGP